MAYYQAPTGEVFTSDYEHPECTRLTLKAGKAAHRAYACTQLRAILSPGMVVHTILRHVSRSGMMRHISVIGPDSRNLDYLVSIALDDKLADGGGIKCGGCGMDMGFNLVYCLGFALWPKGTPEPHGKRNGEPDSSGGYALKHAWL
jgi:hypothetical protein